MAVQLIVSYPDPRLALPCEPITAFDDRLAELANDLLDTMRAAPGIGIAGPHIGVLKRVFVVQLADDQPVWICVNPVITWTGTESARHSEGSISLPGAAEEIERPAKVRMTYQDLAGASHEIEAEGLLSVCFQHELDQIDGMFWLKRLSRLKRDRLLKRYQKRR